MTAADEFVSRKAVRHMIVRRLNERIAELRDDRPPRSLWMHPETLDELLIDSDPSEQHTVDFEGKALMGVLIVADPSLEPGEFRLDWPTVEAAEA